MTYIHLPNPKEKKAVSDYDWHSVDDLPEHIEQQVLTCWTDGEYEVIRPGDYPEFWEGKSVSNATLTHWRYIDSPSN